MKLVNVVTCVRSDPFTVVSVHRVISLDMAACVLVGQYLRETCGLHIHTICHNISLSHEQL
jgi:hypothetical protein